jgi:carbonic anhydrase/acetyltransferase-like protein (isoleucine patch superfamily)
MPIVRPVLGHHPEIGKDSFIAENATIIGNFSCGEGCSFWYGSVIRADVNAITMGNKVNVQDGAVIHCTYQKYPTIIGNNVSIGHNALVHGCTIKDNVLIGMGSIVMDDCVVEENSIIAAGAVLTKGTHVPSGSVFAGVPAKKIKDIDENLSKGEIQRIADNYIKYSSWYQQ